MKKILVRTRLAGKNKAVWNVVFCVKDAEKFKFFLFPSIHRLRDVGWTDVRPTQNARLPWSYDGNGRVMVGRVRQRGWRRSQKQFQYAEQQHWIVSYNILFADSGLALLDTIFSFLEDVQYYFYCLFYFAKLVSADPNICLCLGVETLLLRVSFKCKITLMIVRKRFT